MSAAAENIFDEIEAKIGGVPAHAIMLVWERVEPLLQRVVKPETGYSLDSVLTALQLSAMQLWIVNDFQAAIVTSIQERPLHRVLWVQFLAGDSMDEWLSDWIAVQEEYAKHNGCAAIEFQGRRGWNKVHEKHRDYKPMLTIFRKELSE